MIHIIQLINFIVYMIFIFHTNRIHNITLAVDFLIKCCSKNTNKYTYIAEDLSNNKISNH